MKPKRFKEKGGIILTKTGKLIVTINDTYINHDDLHYDIVIDFVEGEYIVTALKPMFFCFYEGREKEWDYDELLEDLAPKYFYEIRKEVFNWKKFCFEFIKIKKPLFYFERKSSPPKPVRYISNNIVIIE